MAFRSNNHISDICVDDSTRNRELGTFEYLVNQAAFIDKLTVSIDGERKEEPSTRYKKISNIPIAGKNSLYGRLWKARSCISGNSIQLKYAKQKSFEQIPPIRAIFKSDKTPLTCAQVLFDLSHLLSPGFKANVAEAEFTFDVTDVLISEFRNTHFTRARGRIELKSEIDGRETIYVGSPSSPWQLRVYQKTNETTRIEFVFRKDFLAERKIFELHQLIRLKRLKIEELVWLQEWNREALQTVIKNVATGTHIETLAQWPACFPQMLERCLKEYKVDTAALLSTTDLQKRIKRMQKQFVW